jgi:uncharacterized membrane protein YagU involved in acid resistance
VQETVMNGKRWAGAIAGGLVAGLGITALLVAGERKSGEPSELAQLERAAAAKIGRTPPPADQLPDASEQAVVQGAHLLLSVLAGMAYAAATDDEAAIVPSGIGFGLAFYTLAHWVAGPALGLKRPEWESDGKTIAMHTLNHLVFGLAVAGGAKAATQAS